MKKIKIILILLVLFFIFGFSISTGFLYVKNKELAKKNNQEINIEKTINEETVNNFESFESSIIQTNAQEDKVSPNANLILKKYYKKCGHTIKDYSTVPEELVNKDSNEVEKMYEDWELIGFSPNEIVLFKQFDGICNEHYVLRQKDGVVAIFTIDENNNEFLREKTSISTEYLSKTDIEKLEDGIKAIGREELNSILEDYE